MIAIGFDPGTRACGWGVVVKDGSILERAASGVMKPKSTLSLHERLGGILSAAMPLCNSRVDVVACEDVWVGKNARSALVIGSARGVIMAAAGLADRPFALYPPATVKKAVAGYGRANKDEVQRAVRALLELPKDFRLAEDESDALAVAITAAVSFRP